MQNPVAPSVPGRSRWTGRVVRRDRDIAVVDAFVVRKGTHSKRQAASVQPAQDRQPVWRFQRLHRAYRSGRTVETERHIGGDPPFLDASGIPQHRTRRSRFWLGKRSLIESRVMPRLPENPVVATTKRSRSRPTSTRRDCDQRLQDNPPLLEEWLYTVIYYQGVTAMRRGENDNCINCQGGLLLYPSLRALPPCTLRPARAWRSSTSRSNSVGSRRL